MLIDNIFKDNNILKLDYSISLNAPINDLYSNDLYYSGEISNKIDNYLFFDSFEAYENKNDLQNNSLNNLKKDSWKNDSIKFNNPINFLEDKKNKNLLFKIFKRFKINFYDNPVGNDDSLIYIYPSHKGTYLELLEENNYNIYPKMKEDS